MKIVVLDGYVLNPGDLSWSGLEELGSVTVHDRTPSDLIAERIGDAEAILTNKTPITRAIMAQKPALRYIGVLATGYNIVDTAAAREFGIVVTNVPAYSTPSVVQHVFALLLELCGRTGQHTEAVRNGEWAQSIDFSFRLHSLMELSGKTLGIIGMGKIGTSVAKVAEAFDMKVITASSRDLASPALASLYRDSDIITLHCPLTDANAGMIDRKAIAQMKDGVLLINTARGGLLNDRDVVDALVSGKIGGLGADVLTTEPPEADNPLLHAPNTFITPHVAWAPFEARTRLMQIAVGNVRAFRDGKPINQVN